MMSWKLYQARTLGYFAYDRTVQCKEYTRLLLLAISLAYYCFPTTGCASFRAVGLL